MIWIGYLCHFGIDLTDEGYNLVTIANPLAYQATTSQFGLIYSPLFEVLNGDLVLFRIINLLLIYGLSFVLILRCINLNLEKNHGLETLSISSGFALTALVFLSVWQPSPSYNTLNEILLLLLAHLLISIGRAHRVTYLNWLFLGFLGGALFVVKATTAGVVGVVVYLYLALTKKLSWSGLAICILSALAVLVLVAVIMDDSLTAHIERISVGIANGRILLGDEWASLGMLWRGKFRVDYPLLVTILSLALVSVIGAVLYSSSSQNLAASGAAIILGLAGFGILVVVDAMDNPVELTRVSSRIFLVLAIPLAGLLICGINHFRSVTSHISTQRMCLIIVFCIFPYSFAVGSFSNYFYVGLKVGVFLVGATLLLFSALGAVKIQLKQLLVLSVSSVLVVSLLVDASISHPHRQPAGQLTQNAVSAESAALELRLRLPKPTYNYLVGLENLARENGLLPADSVIDLTGMSPGTLFWIGAKNLGSAWMIGGYSGSDLRAIISLQSVPQKELDVAWLLIEPDGPRSLNTSILHKIGRDLENDYTLVGQVTVPQGLGGRKVAGIQQLYRPAEANR